jgi:hypothetical protein
MTVRFGRLAALHQNTPASISPDTDHIHPACGTVGEDSVGQRDADAAIRAVERGRY